MPSEKTVRKRGNFRCGDATDCATEPHYLLFPTPTSGGTVDPKWMVRLHPQKPVQWLKLSCFSHVID